jgi:hypothetical protein
MPDIRAPSREQMMEGYDAELRIRCNPELNTNPVCKRLETRAMLPALPPSFCHTVRASLRINQPSVTTGWTLR